MTFWMETLFKQRSEGRFPKGTNIGLLGLSDYLYRGQLMWKLEKARCLGIAFYKTNLE